MLKRKIAVVTGSRADYGIYRPVLHALFNCPDVAVELWVTGMHLAPEFGLTVREIERDGFPIAERIPTLLHGDSPQAIGQSIGLGTMAFSPVLARKPPDILLVLGDRFEMFAAAVAALPHRVPVAHIHGGEVTSGAIDDTLRHCLTKLSHLHFVSTEEYAGRVIQLGEEPWRVTVCGAPSLDSLVDMEWMDKAELERTYNIHLDVPPLLVTFHPATLEREPPGQQAEKLASALQASSLPLIVTAPNADTGGRDIATRLRRLVSEHPLAWWIDSMGSRGYFSLMRFASAMVGNSSSGLLEAPSFRLPVVNIGSRQDGRVKAGNIIDVLPRQADILEGIRRAVSPAFRRRLKDLKNPYGTGNASKLICDQLQTVALESLILKRFHDIPH